MPSVRTALLALLFALPGARLQAQKSGHDTLPASVAQRALDAYRQHNLDATFAEFDSVFLHERLGDPAGTQRFTRAEWLARMKGDPEAVRAMNSSRIENVQRNVFGPFVVYVWTMRGPKGEQTKHFDLVEVRHGKVVREIEADR